MLEGSKQQELRRSRARVISGPYQIVDENGVAQHSSEQIDSLLEEKSKSGRLDVSLNRESSSVALNYHHHRFGKGRVETLDEIRTRHKNELESASKEMESLKQMAEKQVEEAYQKGLKEGHAKGLEEGRQEYADKALDMQQRVQELLEATEAATTSYFTQIEDRLVEFAMSIARKVVGTAVEQHREIAVKLAKDAIEQATERSKILLIVNPVDLDILKEHKVELMSVATGIKKVEIETSERVHPGGVILESDGGSIDATILTMLDEAYKAVKPGYDAGVAGEDKV